jgi:hypothetical protein
MSDMPDPIKGPASTPPAEDAGADTQRRFRHQACYAAILSLGLLDADGPLIELYCEHHDDILLRLKSGRFRALQLKTKLIGGVPFKACDDEVIAALGRFAHLESTFQGQFETYALASNVGFWHEKKNSSNLPHLLDAVRGTPEGGAQALVQRIYKKAKIDITLIGATLQKVELVTTPGLDDIEARLRDHLATIPELRDRRYDELREVSDALRQRIFEAASLAGLSSLPEYLVLCTDSSQAVVNQHIIATKRIQRVTIIEILSHALTERGLLKTHAAVSLTELPRGMRRMELKLAAGGLSVSVIDHLKDLKFSTESLLQGWIYRYGSRLAQEYYEHLRVLVRDECLRSQRESDVPGGPFGKTMLSELRENIARRLHEGFGVPLECSQEHLLGMAGILTEDCKVWWSSEFALPGDVQ